VPEHHLPRKERADREADREGYCGSGDKKLLLGHGFSPGRWSIVVKAITFPQRSSRSGRKKAE
jgi:hypothetical protein